MIPKGYYCVHIRLHHLFLFWTKWFKSIPLPPILSGLDLILSYLCLGLPTKIIAAHYTVFDNFYNIWWALNIKSSSLYTSTKSCYFFPLRSKHLLQHLFSEHPQLMLLPECKESKFHTHIIWQPEFYFWIFKTGNSKK